MEIVPPLTIEVVDKIMSVPAVPAFPIKIQVPAPFKARKCPAVPVLPAVPEVIVLAVAVARPFVVPPTAEPKAGFPRAKVTSKVPVSLAVVLAGWPPV
jgi:hypothetical protein